MYRLAVWCGIACFAVMVVTEQIFKTVVPESVIQVVWIALITGFAAWCGYRVPTLGWQAGATIIVVMWFGWVALWLVTGELFHPSTSTGGLVAVFISGLLTALVSPLPMLAAELAARVRRWHDRHAHSSSGGAS